MIPERSRPDAGRRRGSTLLLFPVGVLVLVVLGGIAVDSTVAFSAQRELVDATQAAANDAATYGADAGALRTGRGYRLDRSRVETAVRRSFALHGLADAEVQVDVVAGRVVVRARRRVATVFGRAVPGGPTSTTVTAQVTGTPRAGR